jgi:pyruvate/2-oxoglutarate dehydrogenase complex dihydrolipoamide dehydrogenase (E3) component
MQDRYGGDDGEGGDDDDNGNGGGIVTDASLRRMIKNVKAEIVAARERIYLEDDSPDALRKLGIDCAYGRAILCDGGRSVKIISNAAVDDGASTSRVVRARHGIVVATGASPCESMYDDIAGLDGVPHWTYENVWDEGGFFDVIERDDDRGGGGGRKRVTETRVIVVGGGPIGCELSQAISRLGCNVVLISGSGGLLPTGEAEASAELKRVFEDEGIDVICDQRVLAVTIVDDGTGRNRSIVASLESHAPIVGDHILIATGRVPNVKNLGLEEIGIELNPITNGISVDEKLRTSVKGVYAAGDCTGDRQYTHYAGFQGAIAARNILFPLKDAGVLSYVPSTTFTDPEVASFGPTERAAVDKYGEGAISISFRPLARIDRAVCEGTDGRGFIKIVYSTKTRQILGATVMAPSAGELVSELSAIQAAKMPFDKLATVMHSYPSYSIALQQMAAEVYYDKLKKNKSLYDFLKRAGL